MSHSSDDTADVDVIEVVTRGDIMCSASDALDLEVNGDGLFTMAMLNASVGADLEILVSWSFDVFEEPGDLKFVLVMDDPELVDDTWIADDDDELDDDYACSLPSTLFLVITTNPSRFLCVVPSSLWLLLCSVCRLMLPTLLAHALRWALQFDKNVPPL